MKINKGLYDEASSDKKVPVSQELDDEGIKYLYKEID